MPLTREEIEAKKAAATGQALAPTTGPGALQPVDAMISEVMKFEGMGTLDRALVAAVMGQPNSQWSKAFNEGGQTAVMVGLKLVRDYGLDPLTEPKQLYIMAPERGAWQARLSAHGLAAVAAKSGHPIQGLDFEDLGEVERDGEPYVVVKVRVRLGNGVFSGVGRKPRSITLKNGGKKWDKDAEGKAETMAVRRALEFAAVGIDWSQLAPALDTDVGFAVGPDGSVGVVVERPKQLAPGSTPVVGGEAAAAPEPDLVPSGEGKVSHTPPPPAHGGTERPDPKDPGVSPPLGRATQAPETSVVADVVHGAQQTSSSPLLSDAQMRELHRAGSEQSINHDGLSAIAQERYSVNSMKDLTVAQASDFIEYLHAPPEPSLGWDE